MITRSTLSLSVALVSGAWATLQAQDIVERADADTRRLAPSHFRQLPERVRMDLERRGCTVPQLWSDTLPGNVITGHFRTARQADYAVLCSVNQVSAILVYWSGRADSVAEFASAPDKDYLQGVGNNQIGFSRAIGVADTSFIRSAYQELGGTTPPRLDHEGIEDAFVEKASHVWYWHDGKWLRLAGMD